MKKIQVLEAGVVDQIAAGEVVERPSHLLKELVENAIDAGATRVEVEFDQGGRRAQVSDNGSGIASDQLALALARHATSKIKQSSDIWDLHSFGFRGEALASIAAVSRLSITSKPESQDQAYQVQSEFGKISEPNPVGGDQGTTVLVEELFTNVPARLKFLKSDAAESSQIKNTLKALAMANPSVEFRVRSGGQLLFYWAKEENLIDRVQSVLDQDSLHFASGEYDGIKVQAVVSSPNQTVRSSRQIWLFAQGRWVQDRRLQAAVLEAYRNLLMHGEYPVAAIFVQANPQEIDVNIHPTKSQVKFQNSTSAFRAVNRSLRSMLETAPWVDSVTSSHIQQTSDDFELSAAPVAQQQSLTDESFKQTKFQKKDYPQLASEPVTMQVLREASETYISNAASEPSVSAGVSAGLSTGVAARWSLLQVLGQSNLTYIICQSEKAMVFVDQHAAHERIMFERLMHAYKTGVMERQSYLLPLQVALDPAEVEAVLLQKDDLEKLGFDIDPAGAEALAIRSAPAFLKDKGIAQAMQKLGAEIVDKGDSFAFENYIAELFSTMACHSAIRAGQALSAPEMTELLVQMDEFPLSSFCPHGRPVFVEYPFAKLEKDFGRIV